MTAKKCILKYLMNSHRYQVAVGTTPGGGQVKAFYKIPADSKHHTVTGLNLDGYRQVMNCSCIFM